MGNAPQARHDEAANGVVVFVRELGVGSVFKVGDQGEPADQEVARGEGAHVLGVLAAAPQPAPEEPVKHLVGGEDAAGAAVFIDQHDELDLLGPHRRNRDFDADGLGDRHRRADEGPPIGRLVLGHEPEEVLGVQHPKDVVQVFFKHGVTGVLVGFDLQEHVIQRIFGVNGHDFGTGDHDLVGLDRAELEGAAGEEEF